MLLEHIRFENRQALKIEIDDTEQIGQALEMLGLAEKHPVIVIVGGAGGIRDEDWGPIRKAMDTRGFFEATSFTILWIFR